MADTDIHGWRLFVTLRTMLAAVYPTRRRSIIQVQKEAPLTYPVLPRFLRAV